MKIFTEIIGNANAPEWAGKLSGMRIEHLDLDQWTAQKSRLVGRSDNGNEYAVALKRHTQLLDGDILEYDTENRRAVVIRIALSEVMVIELGGLMDRTPETAVRIAVELGHAIGNQHWPAVIKGTKAYVPLTVDRKVMESVMHTHRIEDITCSFQPGAEVIPYLAPHEIRRLFGGTGPDSETHHHHHEHSHEHC